MKRSPRGKTLAVAALAICELLSLAISALTGSSPTLTGGYLSYYAAHPRVDIIAWFAPMIPHPYFGYQYDKGENLHVNNHGFRSEVDYPYVKGPNDFVIGILGGSVPEQLALEMIRDDTLSELSKRLPGLKNKHIVVLNLCLPAGKQPQQFMVASYFLKMLDLLVNIDGTWETFQVDRRYPADYPQAYHHLYGTGALGATDRLLLNGLLFTDERMTRLPLALKPLAWSSTYFLAWKIMTRAKEGTKAWVLNAARAKPEAQPVFFPHGPKPREENARELLDSWARYTELESSVAAFAGKRAITLVRPSQYYRPTGSTPVHEFFVPGLQPSFQERFKAFLGRASELKKKGLQVYDLTDAFDRSPEAYEDSIDHLNVAGRKILAERVLETLVQALSERPLKAESNRSRKSRSSG